MHASGDDHHMHRLYRQHSSIMLLHHNDGHTVMAKLMAAMNHHDVDHHNSPQYDCHCDRHAVAITCRQVYGLPIT